MSSIDGPVSSFNATSINDFGVALFGQILDGTGGGDDGAFLSPVCVVLALALLLNGALPGSLAFWQLVGITSGENIDPLNPSAPAGMVLSDTNALLQSLVTQMRISAVNEVQLSILNSIWLKQPYEFSPPYNKSIQRYFGAYAQTLTDAQQINEYAKSVLNVNVSAGMAPKNVSAVNSGLMLNAVFFKSAWANKFPVANTDRVSFDPRTGGAAVPCNMMNRIFGQNAAEYSSDLASHQAIRIPFLGRAFYATAILPTGNNSVAATSQLLRAGGLSWSRPKGGVNVAMPRFSATYEVTLQRLRASKPWCAGSAAGYSLPTLTPSTTRSGSR